MGHKYADIMFTESVRAVQEQQGSRQVYSRMEGPDDYNHLLGEKETVFIQARDSFYMASVSETGRPYLQHRGGPVGFMRVLDAKTIGFADFRGNRQYISVGNLRKNDRVSLLFMDYPGKARLKVSGRARLTGKEDAETLSRLEIDHYRARVEHGIIIDVEAFDWNCPQHISPRYTQPEVDAMIAARVKELLAENNRLRSELAL